MPHEGGEDRRVRKTKRLLHEALATLVHQKPVDDIAVKEILARADVGRSTFYAHFRDKEELLASVIRELLRTSDASEPTGADASAVDVLRFSLPLFEHVERHLDRPGALSGKRAQARLHACLRHELADHIAARLRHVRRGWPAGDSMPLELRARVVATTFVVVLDWWTAQRPRPTAREADARFRELVAPASTT